MSYKKLVGTLMLLLSLLFVVEAQFPFNRPSRHVLNGGGGLPPTTTTPPQEVVWTLSGVTIKLADILALSFIVIFILILLVLGGVWKPSGGLPWFQFIFIGLLLLFLIVPMIIPLCSTFEESKSELCIAPYTEVPSNLRGYELPPYAKFFFHKLLGLPEQWGYVPAIIYLFILPFAAVYTLVWAFLQSLGIFSNVPSSVNRVLALIVAFLSIPVGYFIRIVSILFGFLGIWSIVVFVATFIVGAFFRGATTVYREKAEFERYAKTTERAYKSLIGKLESIKKLPSEDQRRVELDKLITQYGTELHLAGEAYSKAMTAKEKPTDENINAVIQEIKNKVKI
jgi:hypothetical protein